METRRKSLPFVWRSLVPSFFACCSTKEGLFEEKYGGHYWFVAHLFAISPLAILRILLIFALFSLDCMDSDTDMHPSLTLRACADGGTEVLDPVRRRWVAMTPEERVRQQTLLLLHHALGYPYELMQVEAAISLNGMSRRCDIVVCDRRGHPYIIVECKRPDVAITQKVCDQACRYNTVLRVPLLLLTNGVQQVVVEIDYESRRLRQLDQLPPYRVLG